MSLRLPLLLTFLFVLARPPALAEDFEHAQRRHPRVQAAFTHELATLRSRFREAGAAWPPRGLFLRAFKAEDALELWAETPTRQAPLTRVETFNICSKSGILGPKRREGDRQVPEGIYAITRFNPRSAYHLSLGLDYPNAFDRAQADGPPGGDIFIHGSCFTIGCLPLTDPVIERLYVAAVLARDKGQRRIPIHIFPCRFGDPACEARLKRTDDPTRVAFWATLRPLHAAFERSHRLPNVRTTAAGYRLAD